MARDSVTVTDLTLNAEVAETAGTTVSVANGASIAAGGDLSGVFIVLKNTNASARVATIPAPTDNYAAITSGIGDLAISVDANTGVEIVCLEGSRFLQSDGTVHVDFAASFAGTVHAYRLPKAAR